MREYVPAERLVLITIATVANYYVHREFSRCLVCCKLAKATVRKSFLTAKMNLPKELLSSSKLLTAPKLL